MKTQAVRSWISVIELLTMNELAWKFMKVLVFQPF